MRRFLALVGLAAICAGCTIERAAEPQTAASVAEHLRELGVRADRSLRISRAELEAVKGSGRGLPWLQVFDRSGVMIHEEDGYTLGMGGRLERSLERGTPVSPPRSLAEDSAKYETFDGEPVVLEPDGADFVFVDHWATWCAPCKPHTRALQQFISEHPEWKIDLVLVDWDEMAAGAAAAGGEKGEERGRSRGRGRVGSAHG